MNKKKMAQRMRELLEEISPQLDEIMEICRDDGFLRAYVPGNVWAKRYGFLGKSGLDYLEEWINRNDPNISRLYCIECDSTKIEIKTDLPDYEGDSVVVCGECEAVAYLEDVVEHIDRWTS